jgi:hypothetical protein
MASRSRLYGLHKHFVGVFHHGAPSSIGIHQCVLGPCQSHAAVIELSRLDAGCKAPPMAGFPHFKGELAVQSPVYPSRLVLGSSLQKRRMHPIAIDSTVRFQFCAPFIAMTGVADASRRPSSSSACHCWPHSLAFFAHRVNYRGGLSGRQRRHDKPPINFRIDRSDVPGDVVVAQKLSDVGPG